MGVVWNVCWLCACVFVVCEWVCVSMRARMFVVRVSMCV